MKILVFAPHPDDDVIGCGGSIIKQTRSGNKVTVVYMTSGEAGNLDSKPVELAQKREQESAAAGKILGLSKQIFLKQPDGYVEKTPQLTNRVTQIIREEQSEVVYLPHKKDAHPDHKATFEIVTDAIWRAGAKSYPQIPGEPWVVRTFLAYEVWTPLSKFSYTEDISEFIDKKIAALNMHASQLTNVRFDEAVEGFNRYRGAMTEVGKYCECFNVLKTQRIY